MKNKLKSSFILLAIAFLLPISVNAKVSVSLGTTYSDGHDTTQAAIVAYDNSKALGYTSYIDLSPSVSEINNYIQYLGNSTGNLLFFTGHARSDRMVWNYNGSGGNFKVGVTNGSTGLSSDQYNLRNIGDYAPSRAYLTIFMGCQTALGTNNIARSAYLAGSTYSIGWTDLIYPIDEKAWAEKFFMFLRQGKNVKQAVSLANSAIYTHNSIKTNVVYTYLNTLEINDFLENKSVAPDSNSSIKIYHNEQNVSKNNIIDHLKEHFVDFDENNYIVEETLNYDEKIYDFILKIDEARTNIGYTIKVKGKNIEIFDNMNGFTVNDFYEKDFTISTESKDNFKQQVLDKYKNDNEKNYSIVDSQLFYDVLNEKLFYNIDIKEVDKNMNTIDIITEVFVI